MEVSGARDRICHTQSTTTARFFCLANKKNHRQVLLDGSVYITGGFGGGNRTLMLGTEGWEELASMNQARAYHACIEHQGKLWVIGGEDGDPYLDSVEIFDPATEVCQPGPSLPVTITSVQAVSWGGSIWVLGGFTGYPTSNDKVFRLGEAGQTWEDTGIIVPGGFRDVFPAQIVNMELLQCS